VLAGPLLFLLQSISPILSSSLSISLCTYSWLSIDRGSKAVTHPYSLHHYWPENEHRKEAGVKRYGGVEVEAKAVRLDR
jgi:hypothetical protein